MSSFQQVSPATETTHLLDSASTGTINPALPAAREGAMQAIVQRSYGSADVFESETLDLPTIGPSEVLIEVHSAALDRGTWHLMTGTPYLIKILGFGFSRPKQPIPGLDVAGIVTAVGRDVTRFATGDEVFGIANGSFAEYAAASEDKLVRKPANLTFESAAAAAVSGITALEALTDVGKLQSGQHVLVVGASGGVGTYAVQLAKALARIIHGVASISRRDLFSQGILFSRRILIDICKRKNLLWNQRSSEMPSIS